MAIFTLKINVTLEVRAAGGSNEIPTYTLFLIIFCIAIAIIIIIVVVVIVVAFVIVIVIVIVVVLFGRVICIVAVPRTTIVVLCIFFRGISVVCFPACDGKIRDGNKERKEGRVRGEEREGEVK